MAATTGPAFGGPVREAQGSARQSRSTRPDQSCVLRQTSAVLPLCYARTSVVERRHADVAREFPLENCEQRDDEESVPLRCGGGARQVRTVPTTSQWRKEWDSTTKRRRAHLACSTGMSWGWRAGLGATREQRDGAAAAPLSSSPAVVRAGRILRGCLALDDRHGLAERRRDGWNDRRIVPRCAREAGARVAASLSPAATGARVEATARSGHGPRAVRRRRRSVALFGFRAGGTYDALCRVVGYNAAGACNRERQDLTPRTNESARRAPSPMGARRWWRHRIHRPRRRGADRPRRDRLRTGGIASSPRRSLRQRTVDDLRS